MPPKDNQPKRNVLKNSSVPKENNKGTRKRRRKNGKALSFLSNEKYHLSVGVFLAFFSIYLFVAFTSYLFDYFGGSIGADDLAATGGFHRILIDRSLEVSNWGGRLGAYFGWQFIKGGFGIASYIIIFLMFLAGIHLSLKVALLPYWRAFRNALILLLWLSTFMGYVFGSLEGTFYH
jgi:DNA segregation ATPase FtsK/SpoIIIE, S-DNA-T family